MIDLLSTPLPAFAGAIQALILIASVIVLYVRRNTDDRFWIDIAAGTTPMVSLGVLWFLRSKGLL